MFLQDILGRSFRTSTAPSAHYGEILAKREEEAQQQEFDHSKMTCRDHNKIYSPQRVIDDDKTSGPTREGLGEGGRKGDGGKESVTASVTWAGICNSEVCSKVARWPAASGLRTQSSGGTKCKSAECGTGDRVLQIVSWFSSAGSLVRRSDGEARGGERKQ